MREMREVHKASPNVSATSCESTIISKSDACPWSWGRVETTVVTGLTWHSTTLDHDVSSISKLNYHLEGVCAHRQVIHRKRVCRHLSERDVGKERCFIVHCIHDKKILHLTKPEVKTQTPSTPGRGPHTLEEVQLLHRELGHLR